jgi:hypothetical protein
MILNELQPHGVGLHFDSTSCRLSPLNTTSKKICGILFNIFIGLLFLVILSVEFHFVYGVSTVAVTIL